MRPWTGIIPEEEERRYQAAGFGGAGSVGRRAGLLIIDVQYRTVGTQRKPYWEAIEEYPTACGEDGWRAVDRIAPLLAAFRERGLPVLYPHVAPKNADTDGGRLAAKIPSILGIDAAGHRFGHAVAPVPARVVGPSNPPSALLGHPPAPPLTDPGAPHPPQRNRNGPAPPRPLQQRNPPGAGLYRLYRWDPREDPPCSKP